MCFSGGLLVPLFDPEQAHSLFYWVIPMKRLVYGVGLNDAGYTVQRYVKNGIKNELLWICPFYATWRRMLERCYSEKRLSVWPTYRGCSVDPGWHKFSAFRAWMDGKQWAGNQLDKDILIPGNKVYGEKACAFVSPALNWFLLDCSAARGILPVGVSFHKCSGKYQAQCRNPFTGKKEYLGSFTDPHEAHKAWRHKKNILSCMYADFQDDPLVAIALRKRYA